MKLTLRVSGGFTGLSKEHSIDINSLNTKVKSELYEYFDSNLHKSKPNNLNESWILDNKKIINVDPNDLTDELQKLYDQMLKNLKYKKK